MAEPNLEEIHDFFVDIAKKAGKMILSARPSTSTITTKKNSSDLVTETDRAVESMIAVSVKSKYPTFEFIGEETWNPNVQLKAESVIYLDPIDGTCNFTHFYPYVSISIAFVHRGLPVVGIVYNPFTSQLYHAIHKQGAFLATPFSPESNLKAVKKLSLPQSREPLRGLNQALVAVEWGNERDGNNWEVKTSTFASLAGSPEIGGAMVHSLRSLGSAALNLCSVASGSLDAYWEGGCWAWDVAAGWVILKEAGGILVSGNKGDWDPKVDGRVYLAVRSADQEEQTAFVEEFWSHVKGKLEYDV